MFGMRGSRPRTESGILFSFETDFTGGVKAGPQIEIWQGRSAAAFTPAVIIFIALPGVIPLDPLPAPWPAWRKRHDHRHRTAFRQAHDDQHDHIWVRRGICHPCGKTFTILPDWLAPAAPFSLRCREQACERMAAGDSVEQAAPHCKDPSRLPDPSTLRRWAQRRLISMCCWLKAGAIAKYFLRTPTIVAWDLNALCRILPIEARSP